MNTMTKTKDLEDVIDQHDLEKIWRHLEKIFALDVRVYQQEFKQHLTLQGNECRPQLIIEYGEFVIQPVLNKMLRRDSDYPTWINMLRFLFKEKLAENSELRNYYRSGMWRTSPNPLLHERVG
jgi:hypothetical protein